MYIYIYMDKYVLICIYVHICTYLHICTYMCIYTYIYMLDLYIIAIFIYSLRMKTTMSFLTTKSSAF